MEILFILLLSCVIVVPVILSRKRVTTRKKAKKVLIINAVTFFACVGLTLAFGLSTNAAAADAATTASAGGMSTGLGYVGAGLAMLGSCIGAGLAMGSASAAALGAISEDASLFGKALIFVALAESIALYGLLISIQILNKL